MAVAARRVESGAEWAPANLQGCLGLGPGWDSGLERSGEPRGLPPWCQAEILQSWVVPSVVSAVVLIASARAISAIILSHLARRPGEAWGCSLRVSCVSFPTLLAAGTGQCPPVESLKAGGGKLESLSQEVDLEGPLGTGRPLALGGRPPGTES